LSSPLTTPPSSPSKRRGSMSHYSDLECSPSKRRGAAGQVVSRITEEERRPLFASEVANTLTSMKVDRDPVYKTPAKNGRVTDAWYGSPMHVDGEGVDVAKERKGFRKGFSDLFGNVSPMKVDRHGMVESGSPPKPLPKPPFSPRYRRSQRWSRKGVFQ